MKRFVVIMLIMLLLMQPAFLAEEKAQEKGFSDIIIQSATQSLKGRATALAMKAIGQNKAGQLLLNLYQSRNNIKSFLITTAKSEVCKKESAQATCNALSSIANLMQSEGDVTQFISVACGFSKGSDMCKVANKAMEEFNQLKSLGQNPYGTMKSYVMQKVLLKVSPQMGQAMMYYNTARGLIDKLKMGPGNLAKSIAQQTVTQTISGQKPSLGSVTGFAIRDVALNLSQEGINNKNCLIGFNLDGTFGDMRNCKVYTDDADVGQFFTGLASTDKFKLVLGKGCNIYKKNGMGIIFADDNSADCKIKIEDQKNSLKTEIKDFSKEINEYDLDLDKFDVTEIVRNKLEKISEDFNLAKQSGTFIFDQQHKLIYFYLITSKDTSFKLYNGKKIDVSKGNLVIYVDGQYMVQPIKTNKAVISLYGPKNIKKTKVVPFTKTDVKFLKNDYVRLEGKHFGLTSDQTSVIVKGGKIELKSADDFIVKGTEVLVNVDNKIFGLKKISEDVEVKSCTSDTSTKILNNQVNYCIKDSKLNLNAKGKGFEINTDGKLKFIMNSGTYSATGDDIEIKGDVDIRNSGLVLKNLNRKLYGLKMDKTPTYGFDRSRFKLNNLLGTGKTNELCLSYSSKDCGRGLVLTYGRELQPKKDADPHMLRYKCIKNGFEDYCSIWLNGIKLTTKNTYRSDNFIIFRIKGIYYGLSKSRLLGYFDGGIFKPYSLSDGKRLQVSQIAYNYISDKLAVRQAKVNSQDFSYDQCEPLEKAKPPRDCTYLLENVCSNTKGLYIKNDKTGCWKVGYFDQD